MAQWQPHVVNLDGARRHCCLVQSKLDDCESSGRFTNPFRTSTPAGYAFVIKGTTLGQQTTGRGCSLGLIASNGVMASNPLTPDKSTLGDERLLSLVEGCSETGYWRCELMVMSITSRRCFASFEFCYQICPENLEGERYDWLLLAVSHLTRRLFASMVRGIEAAKEPTG